MKTKSGRVVTVKEHEDKRQRAKIKEKSNKQKKQLDDNKSRDNIKADVSKENSTTDSQGVVAKTITKVQTKLKQLNYIKKNMPEVTSKKRVQKLITETEDVLHKVQKKMQSHLDGKKPKEQTEKKINPYVERYKKKGLTLFNPPQDTDVDVMHWEDIYGNLDNPDSHWIMRWKGKDGMMRRTYTKGFREKKDAGKWKRQIDFIKDAPGIIEKADKGVNSKDGVEKENATIISIIGETGLRIGGGDKKLQERTGNVGVSTLKVSNVTVKGGKVYLDFKGKSHKQNKAIIEKPETVKSIKALLKGKKEDDNLFQNTNYEKVNKYFDNIAGKGYKIKDLRTYNAQKSASDFLSEQKIELDGTKKDIKNVKKILSECEQLVADKLNNTPAMARNSYIPPFIYKDFFNRIGFDETLLKKKQ